MVILLQVHLPKKEKQSEFLVEDQIGGSLAGEFRTVSTEIQIN